MSSSYPNREVRIALTVESFDQAVQFYRDGLGLAVVEQWQTADGRGMILALGPHTTLELFDVAQATLVDQLEVGRRVSGPVRLALQVPDVEAEVSALQQAGATVLSQPTRMRLSRSQCADRNSRWDASDTLSGCDPRRTAERRAILRRHATSRNQGRTHTMS
jgi:catechol 2,3-dioxygenase-like lactoylglutathione lyase family enzyme